MKWVIQMASPDKQAFEGEWMSGSKQVTFGVHGTFLTEKKRSTDCIRSSITHRYMHLHAYNTHVHVGDTTEALI
jgi:hypothetical protein